MKRQRIMNRAKIKAKRQGNILYNAKSMQRTHKKDLHKTNYV